MKGNFKNILTLEDFIVSLYEQKSRNVNFLVILWRNYGKKKTRMAWRQSKA